MVIMPLQGLRPSKLLPDRPAAPDWPHGKQHQPCSLTPETCRTGCIAVTAMAKAQPLPRQQHHTQRSPAIQGSARPPPQCMAPILRANSRALWAFDGITGCKVRLPEAKPSRFFNNPRLADARKLLCDIDQHQIDTKDFIRAEFSPSAQAGNHGPDPTAPSARGREAP